MKLILGYIIIDIGKTWLAFVYAISVFVIMKTIVFNNNNNNENFICVFECTIVNLGTYYATNPRHFPQLLDQF